MIRAALATGCALLSGATYAHPAPNSTLRLDVQGAGIQAEYWVPISELAYARAAAPAGEAYPAYLLRHFGFETREGTPWRVTVQKVRQDDYLGHAFVVAEIRLVPPAGASAREFVVVDDTVTHEVRNHVVFVVARRGQQADLLGALQYPARRLPVAIP
jgi:hypothetical protein